MRGRHIPGHRPTSPGIDWLQLHRRPLLRLATRSPRKPYPAVDEKAICLEYGSMIYNPFSRSPLPADATAVRRSRQARIATVLFLCPGRQAFLVRGSLSLQLAATNQDTLPKSA